MSCKKHVPRQVGGRGGVKGYVRVAMEGEVSQKEETITLTTQESMMVFKRFWTRVKRFFILSKRVMVQVLLKEKSCAYVISYETGS